MLTYGAETWAITERNEEVLKISEREVAYGEDDNILSTRYTKSLRYLVKVIFIKVNDLTKKNDDKISCLKKKREAENKVRGWNRKRQSELG